MRTSYANRGSHLEELVTLVNAQYRNRGLARIDKFPTPITPEKVSSYGKVYGHYAAKSTVDYIGALNTGKCVCFDCKETSEENRFPLGNVHPHQIEYMKNIYRLGGVAFLIVAFTKKDKYFRLDFPVLHEYWKTYEATAKWSRRPTGAASIAYEAFRDEIMSEKGFFLHYLKGLVD